MRSRLKDSRQPYAIVIGLDNTTGLQTARILARRQVPVIALAKNTRHYGCRTRVCQKIIFTDTESDELIITLKTLGPQLNQKAVLFPCDDLSVLLISRQRQQLAAWFHVVLPAPELVEMLLDKLCFYTYAQKEGLPIPRTFLISKREEAEQAGRELTFPCVVKPPVKSVVWQQHSSSKVHKVYNAEELLALYKQCQGWLKTLIVQEWIEGSDTNHYSCNCYFNSASEPLVTFTSGKLRQWPPETGQGCLAVECRNDTVVGETMRLFQGLPYYGLGYLEMKRDERSGQYLIIEPNIGRPTGRSAMAEAGGVELLYTMYCEAVGWPLPPNREQKYTSLKWTHLRRDIPIALSRWRQGELSLLEWWRSYQGAKIDAVFSWSDPLPFLFEFQQVISRAILKLMKRIYSQKYLGCLKIQHELNLLIWLPLLSLSVLAACTPTLEGNIETIKPTATPQETVVAAVPATEPSRPGAPATRTVHPRQLTGYIPNPGMGWQDTQRQDKRFTETVSYKRLNWNDLNPAQDVYDWSPIEKLRADVAKSNGAISFRIRTAQPPPWGNGQTMPAWLIKQGALITTGYSEVEGVNSTEPIYAGCLFLEAHGQFIEALRQRYDGDPRIAFIDIGSYGAYGEWHSEQYDDESDSLDWHARRRIIDMYLGGQGTRPCLDKNDQIKEVEYDYPGFRRTQLIMPYTPWFADSLVYALSRRADIGIRHDALGSEKHQKRYTEEIENWVEQRWPYVPIVFELTSDAYTPEALRRARDFAQTMHASFVHDNLTGQGSDKLVEDMLAVIGYRFTLHQITYTAELQPGEKFAFDMTWENTGSAPPYGKTYPLLLSLTDTEGTPLLEKQLTPNISTWLPDQPVNLKGELRLPADFPTGRYDLRVAFVDPATEQPVLALAIAGRDEYGSYLLGPVKVNEG